jgi:hypothetical protein
LIERRRTETGVDLHANVIISLTPHRLEKTPRGDVVTRIAADEPSDQVPGHPISSRGSRKVTRFPRKTVANTGLKVLSWQWVPIFAHTQTEIRAFRAGTGDLFPRLKSSPKSILLIA